MRRSAWLLIPIGFTVLGSFVFRDSETTTQVVLIDDWIKSLLAGSALLSATALVVASAVRSARFPPLILSCITAVACLCGLPLITSSFGAWSTSAPAVGPDGREYVVLDQWWTTGIGRVASRSLGRTSIDVLVTAETDFPSVYAALVRPATGPDPLLYFSPDGLVVADHGAHTYVAVALDGSRTFDTRNVRELSPFILIDATAKGLDEDVESIAAFVHEHATEATQPDATDDVRSGIPTEASLLAALDSPNPWVRAAARRIVEAGGATLYPEATKRVASGPK